MFYSTMCARQSIRFDVLSQNPISSLLFKNRILSGSLLPPSLSLSLKTGKKLIVIISCVLWGVQKSPFHEFHRSAKRGIVIGVQYVTSCIQTHYAGRDHMYGLYVKGYAAITTTTAAPNVSGNTCSDYFFYEHPFGRR